MSINLLKLRLFAGTQSQIGPEPEPDTPPVVPGPGWNGTATSGFTEANPIPSQELVTTTACIAFTVWAPGQRFASNLSIDVVSFEAERVRMHIEGATFDETSFTMRSYNDVNGDPQLLPSYRFTIDHAACIAQHASGNTLQYYFEVFPSDHTMQSVLLGPYKCYPEATYYDVDLTVNTSSAIVAGSNYHTILTALNYLRTQSGAHNNRIQLMQTGTYPLVGRVTPSVTNRRGHTDITAAPGVTATIGNTSATTWADKDIRPYYDGLRFLGEGIVLDYRYVRSIYNVGVVPHVYDGCVLTNSNGPYALTFGTLSSASGTGGAGPYLYHCRLLNASKLMTRGARSVINCVIEGGADDAVSSTTITMGNVIKNNNDIYRLRAQTPCVTVAWNGVGSATLAKTDTGYTSQNASASAIFTLTDPAGSLAISTGNYDGARALATGTISKLVADINARAGWSAVALISPGDKLDYGSALLSYGAPGSTRQAPFSTSVTSTPITLWGAIDAHADGWQVTGGPRIFALNTFYNYEGALVFLSDHATFDRLCIVGNAMHADGTAPQESFSSKVTSTTLTHVQMEANILIGQTFLWTSVVAGDYVKIRNNVFSLWTQTTCNLTAATIDGNHLISGSAPANATNTSTGGSIASLFVDVENGNFTPQGALLSNLVTPVTTWDANRLAFAGSDVKGAIRKL